MRPSSLLLVPALTILNWSVNGVYASTDTRSPFAEGVSRRHYDTERRQIHSADYAASGPPPRPAYEEHANAASPPADESSANASPPSEKQRRDPFLGLGLLGSQNHEDSKQTSGGSLGFLSGILKRKVPVHPRPPVVYTPSHLNSPVDTKEMSNDMRSRSAVAGVEQHRVEDKRQTAAIANKTPSHTAGLLKSKRLAVDFNSARDKRDISILHIARGLLNRALPTGAPAIPAAPAAPAVPVSPSSLAPPGTPIPQADVGQYEPSVTVAKPKALGNTPPSSKRSIDEGQEKFMRRLYSWMEAAGL